MRQEQSPGDINLVVASNRGPVEHYWGSDNEIGVRRASGGLVSALKAVRKYHQFSWVASAVTPGDRYIAAQPALSNSGSGPRQSAPPDFLPDTKIESQNSVDLVAVPKDVFHSHYDVFSNRILWFLQHSMWEHLQPPRDRNTIGEAWWSGYVPTNMAFARKVAAKARGQTNPVIMLHDYHLYRAPGFIRELFPDAVLQHFIHIPWPGPAVWQPLPLTLRREICRSLLANDIIGFQTLSSAHNFLDCCDSFVKDAKVDYVENTVNIRNKVVRVRAYPISVDVDELREAMNSPAVRVHQERLRQLCGEQTVVRVDRLDPSKNIVRGFRAFEQLLDKHPELQGRVKFLAFLVPSRAATPEYVHYYKEVTTLVKAINQRFGREGFRPVEVFYENNYQQALAGMSLCDVLLVNPLADGMNLVAKEGPIVSTRDSVLILSRAAGAFEQLSGDVISVEPTDVDGTAGALADALAMSALARRKRASALRAKIEKEDISGWITSQMDDIKGVLAERYGGGYKQAPSAFRKDWVPDFGMSGVFAAAPNS
ncbi:MAG: trehalose-6-phosphate synthase [Dehalococcoidia bacterium]|nr:trehalose-6-phosphate synthase [Dehalococcoidia bacterium]